MPRADPEPSSGGLARGSIGLLAGIPVGLGAGGLVFWLQTLGYECRSSAEWGCVGDALRMVLLAALAGLVVMITVAVKVYRSM